MKIRTGAQSVWHTDVSDKRGDYNQITEASGREHGWTAPFLDGRSSRCPPICRAPPHADLRALRVPPRITLLIIPWGWVRGRGRLWFSRCEPETSGTEWSCTQHAVRHTAMTQPGFEPQ